MIRSIRPIWNLASLYFYRWALHDMQRTNPMHPDLPHVVRRINELEAA